MGHPFESLPELSKAIVQQVDTLTAQLKERGHPQPSFDVDGPITYPPEAEIQAARLGLVDAARKLLQLATGPADFTVNHYFAGRYELMVLALLAHYKVYDTVPLHGSISYADLSSKTGLAPERLFRFVRYARSVNVFYEPSQGQVAHTAWSASYVKVPGLQSAVKVAFHAQTTVQPHMYEALDKYGDSQSVVETAAGLAYGLKEGETVWTDWEQRGEGENKGYLARWFAETLESVGGSPPYFPEHAVGAFDWGSLGDGTIVDVGGSVGYIMVPVAKAFPTLKFVTQDLPGRQEGFTKAIPSDLKHRFTFQVHNFFEPQPVKHADVYFLRAILHDWPDPDAIRILRQLVSAFKPSSRIVLFDHILNDKDDPTSARMNTVSGVDLEMMAMLGAKERTREEWVDLIKRADERLELKTINHPPGSGLFGIVIGLK